MFYGLNFPQARPYYILITTFNQDLFQPKYTIYLFQALTHPESYHGQALFHLGHVLCLTSSWVLDGPD